MTVEDRIAALEARVTLSEMHRNAYLLLATTCLRLAMEGKVDRLERTVRSWRLMMQTLAGAGQDSTIYDIGLVALEQALLDLK